MKAETFVGWSLFFIGVGFVAKKILEAPDVKEALGVILTQVKEKHDRELEQVKYVEPEY